MWAKGQIYNLNMRLHNFVLLSITVLDKAKVSTFLKNTVVKKNPHIFEGEGLFSRGDYFGINVLFWACGGPETGVEDVIPLSFTVTT